ncbi:MAG: hypothetical protein A3H27_16735 [Acidobacteria bacterium RIFCSPLOWO2_02_FULL_59_13]|nr:MAG: hypothetical protein A3H27_16735 [Acidobacteria bacterium RIFCSPLOWO2_02_FULL_59_13]
MGAFPHTLVPLMQVHRLRLLPRPTGSSEQNSPAFVGFYPNEMISMAVFFQRILEATKFKT